MSIGIDGCRGGWFCLRGQNNQGLEFFVFENLNQLLEQFAEIIAIDVPVGLPHAGDREVDRVARQMLGPRRSSVFPVPIRPVLYAPNREAASAIGEQEDGRRVGVQTWAIMPKIVELDEIIQADHQLLNIVHECHPEICWTAMNGGVPLAHNKKRAAGRAERIALVQQHFGPMGIEIYNAALQEYRRRDVAHDDILDAFSCLFSAERVENGQAANLMPQPLNDPVGIPMQMVY